MQTKSDIRDALREFVFTQFPVARKRAVGDADSLLEQGIIDSMGVLEIVGFMETEFEIVLSDDEMLSEHFRSINSMVDLIEQKRAGGAVWTS